MPDSMSSTLLAQRRDERRQRVARRAQLIDLQVQSLALDGEVVQDRAARFVGLFDNGAALLAGAIDQRFTIDLGRVDQSLGGESRVVVDLIGGVLRLGQEQRVARSWASIR
jgi:hypothetical protein